MLPASSSALQASQSRSFFRLYGPITAHNTNMFTITSWEAPAHTADVVCVCHVAVFFFVHPPGQHLHDKQLIVLQLKFLHHSFDWQVSIKRARAGGIILRFPVLCPADWHRVLTAPGASERQRLNELHDIVYVRPTVRQRRSEERCCFDPPFFPCHSHRHEWGVVHLRGGVTCLPPQFATGA